jgi:hypothetical protein
MLKAAQQKAAAIRATAARAKRLAERHDARLRLDRPDDDAEWLPQMVAINQVLGVAPGVAPPARDVERDATAARLRRLLSLHLLTSEESNPDE